MSQKFRLKNIDETRHYFLEEIKQNELMSWNYKKVYTALNNIENFLILASTITVYISISAFTSLIGIPIGITSSATGLKICAIAAEIEKCKSIINKKKKKHDQIALLANSKPLLDSNISPDEFTLITNVLNNITKWSRKSAD